MGLGLHTRTEKLCFRFRVCPWGWGNFRDIPELRNCASGKIFSQVTFINVFFEYAESSVTNYVRSPWALWYTEYIKRLQNIEVCVCYICKCDVHVTSLFFNRFSSGFHCTCKNELPYASKQRRYVNVMSMYRYVCKNELCIKANHYRLPCKTGMILVGHSHMFTASKIVKSGVDLQCVIDKHRIHVPLLHGHCCIFGLNPMDWRFQKETSAKGVSLGSYNILLYKEI